MKFGNRDASLAFYGVKQIGAPVFFKNRRIPHLIYCPSYCAAIRGGQGQVRALPLLLRPKNLDGFARLPVVPRWRQVN